VTNFNIDVDFQDTFDALEDLGDKWDTDAVYTVGSNVEYGVYLEFGRGPIEAPPDSAIPIETADGTIFRQSVSGHPPYPWFRPAIREFKANPTDFVTDNTEFSSIREIPNGDILVKAIATALENQMTDNVNAQKAVDRSPGTHPEHPRRDDGNLTASISAVRVK